MYFPASFRLFIITDLYEENGVREYWIVFPLEKSVIIYNLNEAGKYIGSRLFTVDDKIKSTIFPELEIELNYIFKD
jgi:Uma2 family endonuclease